MMRSSYWLQPGAATAQAVTRFIDWAGGLPTKLDAYYLPALFRILPWRRGRGPRPLVGRPQTAELTVDRSVIQRIQTDPHEPDPHDPSRRRHPNLQRPYRPQNVPRYLADQPYLIGYLLSLKVTPELPEDVMTTIAAMSGQAEGNAWP